MNRTAGRRRVKQLTGNHWVPVLELDDGSAVDGSQAIIEWAASHPAETAPATPA
jgi:glutathione S-transferase